MRSRLRFVARLPHEPGHRTCGRSVPIVKSYRVATFNLENFAPPGVFFTDRPDSAAYTEALFAEKRDGSVAFSTKGRSISSGSKRCSASKRSRLRWHARPTLGRPSSSRSELRASKTTKTKQAGRGEVDSSR